MSQKQAVYKTSEQETQDGLAMFWDKKPRELPSTLSGFTPAPDALIQKHGFITALVWGRVWRYCQMTDGVCRAKIETIAHELGMSARNVIRVVKQLCLDEYLKDITPNLRNKPHIYADTGKIRIRVSIEASHSTMTQSHSRLTQSHSTMTESQSETDSESHEESIKKQTKKEVKKETTTTAASQSVLLAYKSCIGVLTPVMINILSQAEQLYTGEWIIDALRVAAENNVKKWSYAEAILKRWARDGRAESNGHEKITWTEIVDETESPAKSGAEIKAKIDAMMKKAEAKRKEKQTGVPA